MLESVKEDVLKHISPQTRILFITLIVYHVTKPRGKRVKTVFNTFLVFSFFRVTIPFSFQHGDQSFPAKLQCQHQMHHELPRLPWLGIHPCACSFA